jgi:hypothetical protein
VGQPDIVTPEAAFTAARIPADLFPTNFPARLARLGTMKASFKV